MSRLAAILAIGLCATTAQAWETVVRDTRGVRAVELRSFVAGTKSFGFSLNCYPDLGDAAVIFAVESPKDYAIRPGAGVTLDVGTLAIPSTLRANDSSETTAVAEGVDVSAVLRVIMDGSALEIGIREIAAAAMTIEPGDYAEAFAQFKQACELE